MEQYPLVSIIIPVYNGANYMRQAIDSALEQTYRNTEVLVINDGSTDSTEEIALSYGDRIRYFRKENGGVSSALNMGIDNMRGEYFSWLSHDDVYTPNKIEKQIKYINDNTLVLCASRFIDKDSKPIAKSSAKRNVELFDWKQAVMYITQNSANGCAFLIPKKAFADAGKFDESLRYCQDVLMWWNVFLSGYSLQFTDDIGVLSRIHNQQVTQTRSDLYKHDAEYIGSIMPQKFAAMDSESNACLYQYAKQEAIRGNYKVVENCRTAAGNNVDFSAGQRTVLLLCSAYGKIRPVIRTLYYKTIRKV